LCLLSLFVLPLACQKSVTDEDTTNADESTDEDNSDDSGDGDGDDECIAEDQIPGTCYCVEPGTQPCFQGCQPNTAMLTCTEVCAQIGETCMANGCAGGETAAHGVEDLPEQPRRGFYESGLRRAHPRPWREGQLLLHAVVSAAHEDPPGPPSSPMYLMKSWNHCGGMQANNAIIISMLK
jgi:hypothetical protein